MKFATFLIFVSLLLPACAAGATSSSQAGGEATQPTPTFEIAASGQVAASAIDACALVTHAEAEAVLGEATNPGERFDADPIYTCSYQTDSYDVVQVNVIVYPAGADAESIFQAAIDLNGYPEVSVLDYRAYGAAPIVDLTVLVGNVEVSIDIVDDTDDEMDLANAIALAEVAISRLP